MILETERLIMDTWQPEDWEQLKPIATDPEVMRYITGGRPWSDEQIRMFVERQRNLHLKRGYCRWRLSEKATGTMIGFCGIGFWRDAADAEIGWWLARSHWGRGLATEAARSALHDGFERAQLPRVTSVAYVENTASIRIMRKLGLEFETGFESDGIRLVRYALTRERYLAQHPNPTH
jgi:RimJ/RimL family protein N-acetyltransferase